MRERNAEIDDIDLWWNETNTMILRHAKEVFGESNGKDTKECQDKIFRIAKQRHKSNKDITHIRQMKDNDGLVLRRKNYFIKRWTDLEKYQFSPKVKVISKSIFFLNLK